MADTKISGLTISTTPLAGTEVLPIVQSGATKQVSVANLTAGRTNVQVGRLQATVSGYNVNPAYPQFGVYNNRGYVQASSGQSFEVWNDTTDTIVVFQDDRNVLLPAGNLIQGTAAKGINFTANTPAAGMTSQLLNWYEEGTWTGTISDLTNNATMGATTCYYTRVGRLVTVSGYIYSTSLGLVTGNIYIRGLPYTAANLTTNWSAASFGFGDALAITAGQTVGGRIGPNQNFIQLTVWNAATGATPMTATQWSSDGELMFSISYIAA